MGWVRQGIGLIIIVVSTSSCGSPSATSVEEIRIGYDETGRQVERQPPQVDLACLAVANEFAQKCIQAGYVTIPIADCKALCSGPIP